MMFDFSTSIYFQIIFSEIFIFVCFYIKTVLKLTRNYLQNAIFHSCPNISFYRYDSRNVCKSFKYLELKYKYEWQHMHCINYLFIKCA